MRYKAWNALRIAKRVMNTAIVSRVDSIQLYYNEYGLYKIPSIHLFI